MRRPSFVSTLLPSSLLVLSCTQTPTETSGLSLEATISSPIVPIGQTSTLTFRLHNLTSRSVSLTFSSSCQVLPFIEDVRDGVVYPPGGAYGCFAVITTITLPPFGEKVITQAVRGYTLSIAAPGAVLPPGSYRGYAVLQSNSRQLELRSAVVAFEIR